MYIAKHSKHKFLSVVCKIIYLAHVYKEELKLFFFGIAVITAIIAVYSVVGYILTLP